MECVGPRKRPSIWLPSTRGRALTGTWQRPCVWQQVTMEAVEQVTGSPQYNVVSLLKAAGCKQVSGTDPDGFRLYAFIPPKATAKV
jgi:hypothetical protein